MPNRYRKLELSRQLLNELITEPKETPLETIAHFESKLVWCDLVSTLLSNSRKPRDVYDLALKFILISSLNWLDENPELDDADVIRYRKNFGNPEFCLNLLLRYYTSKNPSEFLSKIELIIPVCIKVELYKLFYQNRDRRDVNLENMIKKFVTENYGQKTSFDVLHEFVMSLTNFDVSYDDLVKYKEVIESVFCPKARPTKITPDQYLKWKNDTSVKVEKCFLLLMEEQDEVDILTKAISYVQKPFLPDTVDEELYCKSLAKRYLKGI